MRARASCSRFPLVKLELLSWAASASISARFLGVGPARGPSRPGVSRRLLPALGLAAAFRPSDRWRRAGARCLLGGGIFMADLLGDPGRVSSRPRGVTLEILMCLLEMRATLGLDPAPRSTCCASRARCTSGARRRRGTRCGTSGPMTCCAQSNISASSLADLRDDRLQMTLSLRGEPEGLGAPMGEMSPPLVENGRRSRRCAWARSRRAHLLQPALAWPERLRLGFVAGSESRPAAALARRRRPRISSR